MYRNFIHYTLSLLTILYCAPLFAYQVNFNAKRYPTPGSSYSNHTFQLLNNWQIGNGSDTTQHSITLPYLAPENCTEFILRSTFTSSDSLRHHNLRIWILGIEGIVKISLNNQIIRTHVNFPSSYSIDVPAYLVQKNHANKLEILVREPEDIREGIPDFVQIFRPKKYLAVHREVFLEWIPSVHISNFRYNFSKPQITYSYNLTIQNNDTSKSAKTKKIRIIEEIFAPNGNKVFNRFEYIDYQNRKDTFRREIQLPEVLTWSPDSPNLYQIKIEINGSEGLLTIRNYSVGLREIEIRNRKFYLNNQPLNIRGITYREKFGLFKQAEEYPKIYNKIKQDLTRIKILGFNAIRFPHSVPHPYVADLADSLGLFLCIENGIWRIPEEYFTQDKVLQYTKSIMAEIMASFHIHPSVFAIGLGQEIPIHDSYVQKFILILNEYLHQNYKIFTYISPLNVELLPGGNLTDFYLIDKYDSALLFDLNSIKRLRSDIQVPIILANVGFALTPENANESHQYIKMYNFFKFNQSNIPPLGFFIESFSDWEAAIPSRITQSTDDNVSIYPYGLISWNGGQRYLFNNIAHLLAGKLEDITVTSEPIRQTNVFSLTIFISSVLFFLLYRQSFRLRENLKRSLGHPYGFFVDLRDRRIISIFNSTLIGLYTLLLLTNLLAALCYYFHDGLLFEEYVSSILVPLGLKLFYLKISQSPLLLVLSTWLIFTVMQLLLILLLRILSIFSRERVRVRQLLAVCNWAGSPFIFLLPISLLSYQLLHYKIFQIITIITILLYFIWFNYRLGNGLRILFIASSLKVFLIMILTYSTVLSIFLAFFNTKYDIINYFQLLNRAQNLF